MTLCKLCDPACWLHASIVRQLSKPRELRIIWFSDYCVRKIKTKIHQNSKNDESNVTFYKISPSLKKENNAWEKIEFCVSVGGFCEPNIGCDTMFCLSQNWGWFQQKLPPGLWATAWQKYKQIRVYLQKIPSLLAGRWPLLPWISTRPMSRRP